MKEEIKYFCKPTPFKGFSPVGDRIAVGELTGLELRFCFHSLSPVNDLVILRHMSRRQEHGNTHQKILFLILTSYNKSNQIEECGTD